MRMHPKQSNFQLVGYIISRFILEQQPRLPQGTVNLQYSISKFEPRIDEVTEKSTASGKAYVGKVVLEIRIVARAAKSRKNIRKVELEILGIFEGQNMQKQEFEGFCLINGVAHLLSVARAYIANATAATGLPSVIMPLINLPMTLSQAPKERQN